MIWEPFLLALVLGIIVSAGLYFAYLWPAIEPADDEPTAAAPPIEGPRHADVAVGGREPAGADDTAGDQGAAHDPDSAASSSP